MQRIGMPVSRAGRTDIGETSDRVRASAGAFPGGARAPATLMAGIIVLCVAIMVATLWAALDRPWLGVEFVARADGSVVIGRLADDGPARDVPRGAVVKRIFAPGTALSSTVTAVDLIPEPDFMPSYAELDRFMTRQGALARILEAPRVGFELGDGTIFMVNPVQRPLGSLPGAFWIQFVTGVGALLIAGWVFVIRPRDGPPRLFIFSGIAMIASAHAAALYSTRELALPEAWFQVLSLCNFAGALGFGGAAVALFMIYPRPLASTRSLLVVPLFGLLALAIERLRLIDTQNVARYLPMAVDMVAILFFVAAQWYATRRNAADRAVLRWLGLTVTVGAGCFILAIATPLLLGAQPAISQGYAFGFFLLIYVGLAFGLRRYRLFAIGEWSFRVLFFAGASLALLVLDAGMIYLLHLGPEPALGFSLLAVCFLYLPLRDWIWRHTVGRPRMAEPELFRAVVGVAFDPVPGERAARWRALLRSLFDPLELEASLVPVRRVWIDTDGTTMRLPATADAPPYVLRYPMGGRELFSPSDLALARQLAVLMDHADDSRHAHERGVLEERRRISRDLHDDVGARLLSGLHRQDLGEMRKILREAIADVRAIAGALAGDRLSVTTVVADLRYETADRLEAAGVALDWPLDIAEDCDQVMLDYRAHRHFVSALREVVSNVIRHAKASCVSARLAVDGGWLRATVVDDGVGLGEGAGLGNGLRNIEERIGQIGGRVDFPVTEQGFAVSLAIPLRAAVPS